MQKKILTFLFFVFSSIIILAQEPALITNSYTEIFDLFPNPERGWHRYTLSSSITPSEVNGLRDENISLIWLGVYIDSYKTQDLDSAILNEIQNGFDIARNAGLKVNFRCSYNENYYDDADYVQMSNHIVQLHDVLHNNADVLNLVEAGFLGPWGEWHSSTHGDPPSLASRKMVLFNLLNSVPSNRMVLVRRPMFIRDIFENEPGGNILTASNAYSGSRLSRTGYHNDAFLTDDTDMGTYVEPGYDRVAELTWGKNHCRYTTFGGESSSDLTDNSLCPNSIYELKTLSGSYLNDGWYGPILNRWKTDGCYDEIERRFGYRFVLKTVKLSEEVKPGGIFHIIIDMTNVGFAGPHNPRIAELVLTSGGETYTTLIDTDPRWWKPDARIVLDKYFRIPANITEGYWDVKLNLPDPMPSIHDDPRYSIRLANSGIWEASTGYNLIHTGLYIHSSAPGIATNDTNFQEITPLGAPSMLVLTAISTNQIELTWTDNSSSETGFRIYRSQSNIKPSISEAVFTNSANDTTWSDTGLMPNTVYYYWVEAFNGSDISASVTGSSSTLSVENVLWFLVNTDPEGRTLDLRWSNPTNVNFKGVKILRKLDSYPTSTNDGTKVYDGIGTNYADTGLTDGTTYYYTIFTYYNDGYASSGVTNQGVPVDSVPPANVTGLIASTNVDNQIDLSWTNPTDSDFTGVKVIRKIGSAPTSIVDGTEVYDGSGTSYADTGLLYGNDYYYTVFSYDGAPNYSSGTSTGPIQVKDHAPTANVTGLTANISGLPSQVSLNWTNPTNADFTGIRIVIKSNSAPANATDGTVVNVGNITSWTSSTLTTGVTWYFGVYAIDLAGNLSTGVVTNAVPEGLPTGTIVLTAPNGLPSFAHTYSDETNITVTGYQNATGYIVNITTNGSTITNRTSDISTISLLREGSNIIVITMTNSSGYASPQTDVMILDTQSPTGVGSVVIAGGADSVDNQTVAISIDTSTLPTDVVGYYISEENTPPSANSGNWIMGSVPTNVSFALSEGEGTKTVYVWVIDRAGNVSSATSDSVEYSIGTAGIENNTFSISPNPLLKSQVDAGTPMIITYGAEAGAEVQFEVYTMVGNQVVIIKPDTPNIAYWDGKNEGGKEVASGTYLMIMRVDGKMVYKPIKVGYMRK